MKKLFRSVKGTGDLYPPQSFTVEDIVRRTKDIFHIFGYAPIFLPHLEEEGLFKRSVGAVTDIAEKQIFKIESKDIVLRPEGTAGVARFYIENNLNKLRDFYKFYYFGSMFRGERPQKGRLREFRHIGAEAIGSESFYLDAELIELAIKIVRACGIEDFSLKINSLGCSRDKIGLSESIKRKLSQYQDKLCGDCKKRLLRSPLRILDCKQSSCKKIVASLNITSEHLCKQCHGHFFGLLDLLDQLKIAYEYKPLLVRGLDYYTNTVFEITSSKLGAQDALGAGGRYNELIHNLGGPRVPAIGFALGLERILLLIDRPKEIETVKVFVVCTSSEVYKQAFDYLKILRDNGICSEIDYKNKSLKAQLKTSQKINVPFVVIVGDEELKEGCIIIRDMRKSSQEKVKTGDFLKVITEKVSLLKGIPGVIDASDA